MLKSLSKTHQKRISLIFFLSLVAFIYALPIFRQIDNWGIQDWDLHLFYNGVPRVTILEYGQMPLWNPYFVGGTAMLAHPESQFLTPSFLFVLLFGEVIGLKIGFWLHLVIGLLGTYALARHYKLESPAALLASFVFMLNSMFALTFTVGMTWFFSVVYLPWVFLFFLKALSDWRYGLLTGFFLTLMFFTGGAYPLPIALLFLGIYGLVLVVFKEYSLFRLVKLLIIIGLFTFCIGAVKFFPSIEFQRTHPRTLYDYSGYSLNSLRFGLFNRDQSLKAIVNLPIEQPGFLNGVTGGMDENGMYIGLFPFVLFIVGIGLHSKRRMFLLVTLLMFLWISFGNRPRAELWSLLHLVPFYTAMRVAQRFRIVFMLCLAILAGFGFQTFKQYLFRRIPNQTLARFVSTGVLLIVLSDLVAVSWGVFKDAFIIPPLAVAKSETFYQIWKLPAYDKDGWITSNNSNQGDPFEAYNPFHMYSSYGSVYPAFLANLGTVSVVTSAAIPREGIPVTAENYQGEVYLKDTTGSVSISDWSPNRVIVDVGVSNPGFLILNQNYYSGWHVEGAKERRVEEIDRHLAVKVFPDDQKIELYYRPLSFTIGLIVSLVTVLVSLIFMFREISKKVPTQFPAA